MKRTQVLSQIPRLATKLLREESSDRGDTSVISRPAKKDEFRRISDIDTTLSPFWAWRMYYR